MNLSLLRLQEICAGFQRQRIVVLGDVMLDHLVLGEARRISPEAPIPVINFISESHTPGGAANVARNLAALGAQVDLFGVIGADNAGDTLVETLASSGLSTGGLIREPNRATTVKTRITAQRHQVVRLDRETNQPVADATAAAVLSACRTALRGAAAVIIADYAKGVIEQPLLNTVLQHARELGVPVCIDPKPSHPLSMQGCALLTPNRKETFELARLTEPAKTVDPTNDAALLQAIATICRHHRPAALLVTLGESGLLLVEDGSPPRHIPTFARQVSDVTGAGDTVIAAYVLAKAAGATSLEAATLANHAAGIVVAKVGTAVASVAELLVAMA